MEPLRAHPAVSEGEHALSTKSACHAPLATPNSAGAAPMAPAGAMSVFTTRSLLAALGMQKHSGEAAAAINWVLKARAAPGPLPGSPALPAARRPALPFCLATNSAIE